MIKQVTEEQRMELNRLINTACETNYPRDEGDVKRCLLRFVDDDPMGVEYVAQIWEDVLPLFAACAELGMYPFNLRRAFLVTEKATTLAETLSHCFGHPVEAWVWVHGGQ